MRLLARRARRAGACSGGGTDDPASRSQPPLPPGRDQARPTGDPGQDRRHHERADRRQRARQALADPRHHARPRTSARSAPSRSSPSPAYYLAYQLVEQRIVSLEAEGGALITDSDDTERNLDVEVRVGTPKLDNTHPISDDANGLNVAAHPPRRRAVRRRQAGDRATRCGSRPTAATARRRPRSATSAQDQATLSKQDRRRPTSRPSRPRSTSRRRRSSSSTRRSGSTRLKRCSAKALNAASATRGTCAVVFQLNTAYFVNSEGTQIQQSWTNAQLSVSVGVKADDGMNLSRLEQRFGRTPADLPGDAEVDKMIDDGHRRSRRAPRRAARRSVRRPRDPRGPRRRRVLPRGVRPPHRGPPPEGQDQRPDVRELRRQGHRAGLAERLRRSRRSSRSTASSSTASTGSTTRACARATSTLIDHGKLVGFEMGRNPIAGLRALERPRPPLAGPAAGRAPGQPRRRGGEAASTRDDLEKMLIERDQEAAPARTA